MSLLTTAEAAARLGVKRETLYAYVSRGLLRPVREPGSRLSHFHADDVEELRSRRRRHRSGELDAVVATGLTLVEDQGLRIRGVDLIGAVGAGATFETVSHLLWHGPEGADRSLPWPEPDPQTRERVERAVQGLDPGAPLLDRLRTAVCALSAADSLRAHRSASAGVRVGQELVAALPLAMEPLGKEPDAAVTVASRLWCRLTAEPESPQRVRALDG
ncbi:MAG: helix-turn-helix domain-containing protein, partial [Gemmatimonadetes bacterium]|nr:helix-turn-helix domain-containing protein [Gemmatimonadota bacterium]